MFKGKEKRLSGWAEPGSELTGAMPEAEAIRRGDPDAIHLAAEKLREIYRAGKVPPAFTGPGSARLSESLDAALKVIPRPLFDPDRLAKIGEVVSFEVGGGKFEFRRVE